MIEKFAFVISKQNKIVLYRLVGDMVIDPVSKKALFEPNMDKVANSYRYTVKRKIMMLSYYGKSTTNQRAAFYDTRLEAEDAAKEQLRKALIADIKMYEDGKRRCDELLTNMPVKYRNCGGK